MHFDQLPNSYEELTGGGTVELANHMLTLTPPIDFNSVILDNGCGPGIVTSAILSSLPHDTPPPQIYATDNSAGMISLVEARIKHKNWTTVSATIMDATALSFPTSEFTHSYTNLVIFMVTEPVKAAEEIFRTLKPSGVAVVSTWDVSGCLPTLEAAHEAVRPDLGKFKFTFPERALEPAWLEETMVKGGFGKGRVEVVDFECALRRKDVQGLNATLDGMFGWLVKGWSEDQQEKWKIEITKALEDAERRGELVKRDNDICIRMVANVVVCAK